MQRGDRGRAPRHRARDPGGEGRAAPATRPSWWPPRPHPRRARLGAARRASRRRSPTLGLAPGPPGRLRRLPPSAAAVPSAVPNAPGSAEPRAEPLEGPRSRRRSSAGRPERRELGAARGAVIDENVDPRARTGSSPTARHRRRSLCFALRPRPFRPASAPTSAPRSPCGGAELAPSAITAPHARRPARHLASCTPRPSPRTRHRDGGRAARRRRTGGCAWGRANIEARSVLASRAGERAARGLLREHRWSCRQAPWTSRHSAPTTAHYRTLPPPPPPPHDQSPRRARRAPCMQPAIGVDAGRVEPTRSGSVPSPVARSAGGSGES